jgi:signal transduction histidine kinase
MLGRRRNVLLIEDNPGDARLIREILAEARSALFQVEWVGRLGDGLARLASSGVGVVLLDLSLPDSQGLETFRRVRAQAPGVPIVVLSGLDDEEMALRAVREGAQDYLVKGQVNNHLLTRALGYAIERQQAEEAQRFLSEASSTLFSSLDYETTLQRVADLAVPYLGDCCVIDLADESQIVREAAIAYAGYSSEEWLREFRRSVADTSGGTHPIVRVLRTGKPEVFADNVEAATEATSQSREHLRALRELGATSAMYVPLAARGRTLGTIAFFAVGSERDFSPSDLSVATELGRRAAMAIDNAQLYRQAQDAIQLRDTVLSSVAHDLRSPLTPIKLIAETLRWQIEEGGPSDVESIRDGLVRIEGNVQRIAAQIDELLDVAHLQTGREIMLVRRPTDLVALVRESVDDQQRRSQKHHLRVESSVSELVGVWDPVRLERVVGNLLSNAIKYSLPGGDVVVRVRLEERAHESWAILEVQDWGIGISEADLPRIFTWFYRGENVAQRLPGAGIGLAGSRRIVEQHGGSISVDSREGVGSTFTVRLPLQYAPLELPSEVGDPEAENGREQVVG